MKPIVPFLGVLSALWLFLGTWWMSNMVCTPNNASTFSVVDGKFRADSEDPFTFGFSSDKMEGTEKTTTAINKIGNYLKDNPEKQLILTGLYGSSEKNATAHENLGIARAEGMKFLLMKAGASTDNIKATSMEVNNLSFNEDLKMTGGIHFRFVSSEDRKPAPADNDDSDKSAASSKSSSSIEKAGGLLFDPKTPTFLKITELKTDITDLDGFKDYFSELNTYLEKYPNKKLIITGYNDNVDLAVEIGRKVRTKFQKLGLSTSAKIVREEGSVSKSPNGMAGVQIEIK